MIKKLYVVPFAGGSSYSFKHMKELLKGDVDLIAWDGKGKGVNADIPPNTEFKDEIDDFANFLKEQYDGNPYAVWGYSCGGLISYEACHVLQKDGFPMPERLFLAAVKPAAEFISPYREPITDELVMKHIMEMNDITDPTPIMKNIEEIKSGMMFAAKYRYEDKGPLHIPASIMTADDDFVTKSGVSNWSNYFTEDVNYETFHGHHFFYRKQPAKVAEFIKSQLCRH